MTNFKTGALIAIAAGGLFAAACKKEDKPADKPAPAPTADPAKPEVAKPDPAVAPNPATTEKISKIDCSGVNECKGKGTCKTEKHGCGGQNECKGQGVLAMTEEECKAKGGTVVAKK